MSQKEQAKEPRVKSANRQSVERTAHLLEDHRPAPTSAPKLSHATVQRALANPRALAPDDILRLQSTIGNQAVQRLLSTLVSATGTPSPIQTKLQVGAADGRFEREADRVARSVTESSTGKQLSSHAPKSSLQRTEAPQIGPQGGAVESKLASQIQRHKQGGQAVPAGVRGTVEQTTGADFGSVRVHKDKQAQKMNSQLGAKAFTHGNHIFLGSHQSEHDVQLMAHELTHTIQQGATKQQGATGVQRMPSAAPQIQRVLAIDQMGFQNTIDQSRIPFIRSIDPNNKAYVPLRTIDRQLRTLATEVKMSNNTTMQDLATMRNLYKNATILSGLSEGGGYMTPDSFKNAQKRKHESFVHYANMASMFKHKEELIDPNKGAAGMTQANAKVEPGKYHHKHVAYHAGGVAANALFAPYLLTMLGTEGVDKAHGLHLANKVASLRASAAYSDPITEMRRDADALANKAQDRPEAGLAAAALDTALEKLLKKRKAQVSKGTDLDSAENDIGLTQDKFLTGKFVGNLNKKWGAD